MVAAPGNPSTTCAGGYFLYCCVHAPALFVCGTLSNCQLVEAKLKLEVSVFQSSARPIEITPGAWRGFYSLGIQVNDTHVLKSVSPKRASGLESTSLKDSRTLFRWKA